MTGKSDLVDVDATVRIDRPKSLLLDHGGEEPAWVPKSLVEDNGDGTFTMPEWLALEKGMI